MQTILQIATQAENDFRHLFRSKDALVKLRALNADLQKSCDKGGDQVHNLLEVAMQKLVSKLSWDLHKNKDMTPASVGIPELLDLCIAGATENLLSNHAPYKILEELMDGQTIVICEKLWELLETRKAKLTTANFIPPYDGKDGKPPKTTKASLCLLRLSNTLLRRLSKTHNTVFCGRILAFLSFAFALSERSAVNLTGRSNVSNVTLFEDEATFNENTQNEVQETKLDYTLYKTFWDIQRYFRQPNLATESDAEWVAFTNELNTVLTAFESNAFNPKDIDQARDDSAYDDVDDERESFFQTKYLTNSRLFHLQLRDPILRECMLTQFLILFRHLEKTNAHQTQVNELFERVLDLLRATPSDGKGFSEMLIHVLDRENNWTQWKADKCKPYERFPVAEEPPSMEEGEEPPSKKMKPSDSALLDSLVHEDAASLLSKIQGSTRKTAVPVEDFIARFEEARDPENAMEKEYWPDNDKMVCWRTMRACMRNRINYMDKVIEGTGEMVEAILRVQNGGVPAASPAPSTSDEPAPADDSNASATPVKDEPTSDVNMEETQVTEEGEVGHATS
ncbi:unnamed protein product [Aphanomyces euteiches]|uniref:THO complex subunit 1 n=1 Tax=Aphanomyces euteiches TaxID=100861 RepID=A0A6G0XK64_9STRA|nr:hypothetical protein Ae201684_003902 [Aphanomyces euteiches]KAH9084963.1 hypothetical protein Ae201684P_002195 [Aphanomyces euteiches]